MNTTHPSVAMAWIAVFWTAAVAGAAPAPVLPPKDLVVTVVEGPAGQSILRIGPKPGQIPFADLVAIRPVEIRREPKLAAPQRLYGVLSTPMGNKKWGLALDILADGDLVLYLDANANGDLTDDIGPLKNQAPRQVKNPLFESAISLPWSLFRSAPAPTKPPPGDGILRVSINKDGFKPVHPMRGGINRIPSFSIIPSGARLSTNRPPGVVKEPAANSIERWYAVRKLGLPKREFTFLFDRQLDGDYLLYVDSNANGDLTDDGGPIKARGRPMADWSSPWTNDVRHTQYQALFPNGLAKIPWAEINPAASFDGNYETSITMLAHRWLRDASKPRARFAIADGATHWVATNYTFTVETQLLGSVTWNGVNYAACLTDYGRETPTVGGIGHEEMLSGFSEGDGDYTNDDIWFLIGKEWVHSKNVKFPDGSPRPKKIIVTW